MGGKHSGYGNGKRSSAKGRVFSIEEPHPWRLNRKHWVWYYSVEDSEGKIVLCDNTGSFRTIFEQAFRDVTAVRSVENAGHRLVHSYQELVDHTPEDS